jgi:PAS domain S-box-containing protein
MTTIPEARQPGSGVARRISERRYRRLFEAARDGILILDAGTRKITDANPFMSELLGYRLEELLGKELWEIGLLKDETASRSAFRALQKKRFIRYEDLPLQTKAGVRRDVEFVSNLYKEGGRDVIQCNIRDITERKRTDAALRESEERYRNLFDLGPVAIYSCDTSGLIREFNRRATSLWGRTPASGDTDRRFCGSYKLFRPDGSFMPHEQCPMAQVLSGEIARVSDAEVLIERPDGSRIVVTVNIRSLKNERGEITGAINCFYDITERKQAEEAQRRIEVLAASNRKLELEIARRQAVELVLQQSEQHQGRLLEQSRQLQEQLRQVSRQILHAQEEERKRISRELHDEIAQSLVGINMHLAALSRDAIANPGEIVQKIARTQRLVEASVDLVHKFARELRPVALDDLGLLPALQAFMKEFTKQTGITIRFTTVASDRLKQIDHAARTVFYRVAQEALTNVARHAEAGAVEVSLQKLPSAFALTVKDDGKSFQADGVLHAKAHKRLGLLGMRERVEMVGGNLRIESAPGSGTTIRAEIPFANASLG